MHSVRLDTLEELHHLVAEVLVDLSEERHRCVSDLLVGMVSRVDAEVNRLFDCDSSGSKFLNNLGEQVAALLDVIRGLGIEAFLHELD